VTAGSAARPGRAGPVLGLLPLVLLLLALFIWPVASLLGLSFGDHGFTLANYRRLIEVPVYRGVLFNTFAISAMVTVLCVLLSYPLAYLMATVGPRTLRLLVLVVLLPFWTSALVRTTAWIILLQRNGVLNQILTGSGLLTDPIPFVYNLSGVLIGMTHVLMPFVVLPLLAAFRSLDRSVVQAAESLGAGPIRIFRRILLPLTAPGVLAGATIVFMNAVGYYITPSLMGGPGETMIAQMIDFNISKQLDWGLASALAVVLLATTLAVFALFQRIFGLDRLMSSGGSGRAGESFAGPAGRRSIGGRLSAGAGVVVAVFLILPILIVFPMSLGASPFLKFPPDAYSLNWYRSFFANPKWMTALGNSLQVAAIAVTLSVALGTAAAVALPRLRLRGARLAETLFVLPMVVPAIILGVGLFYFFAPLGLTGSPLALGLGHAVLASPYVFVTARASVRGFDRNLEQAALGLGASWPVMFRRVMLPAIAPGIAAGAVFAFITSFDDVVLALFLTNVRSRTLPKLMYEGVAHEIDPTIIAASGLIILLTIAVLALNLVLSRRSR
jgi:ABC-type spermidine/putrescine transport system permease subunit I